MLEIDYDTLRETVDFKWHVTACYMTYLGLTGISIYDYNTDPQAGIELHKKGMQLAKEKLPPQVKLNSPVTPPISYGHANALGAELYFPKDGEVNHSNPFITLQQGLDILKSKEGMDFSTAGMIPFYLNYQKAMQKAFPDEKVVFNMYHEGPITSAYTLRGHDVFFDPYDNPDLFKEFLGLLTQSILEFNRFRWHEILGKEFPLKGGAGLADDISAMFGPDLWPEFVLPFFEQYFSGMTTDKYRQAHIEGLTADHVHYLEDMKLSYFEPSISPQLSPVIIYENCRVPFWWRLGSFHYTDMTESDVKEWVFKAVADGASSVFTIIESTMLDDETMKKVQGFIEACETVDKLFSDGGKRPDLLKLVSEKNKIRFWDSWPRQK
jgi:hypothetical protein